MRQALRSLRTAGVTTAWIGGTFVREVEPGEIIRIDDSGISSRRFDRTPSELAHCFFEHVYFANPASKIFGQTVHTVRERLGRQLAKEAAVPADYVMPMPDSGRSATPSNAFVMNARCWNDEPLICKTPFTI